MKKKFYNIGMHGVGFKEPTSYYDNLPKGVYSPHFDQRLGMFLQKRASFSLPETLYDPEESKFIKDTLEYYKRMPKGEGLGVLLSGEKGTGKTLTSKRLALELDLPIILISFSQLGIFPEVIDFLSDFDTEYVCIIDEVEKLISGNNDRTAYADVLLGYLDGIYSTKKLVIMTSNKESIGYYFENRLRRIRYHKRYPSMISTDLMREVLADRLLPELQTKENISNIIESLCNFSIITIDILISFIDEINVFGMKGIEHLSYMNLVPPTYNDYEVSFSIAGEPICSIDGIRYRADFTEQVSKNGRVTSPFSITVYFNKKKYELVIPLESHISGTATGLSVKFPDLNNEDIIKLTEDVYREEDEVYLLEELAKSHELRHGSVHFIRESNVAKYSNIGLAF